MNFHAHDHFHVDDAAVRRRDPTGTTAIQAKFRRDLDKRWDALRRLAVEAIGRSDILGIGAPTVASIAHSSQRTHHAALPTADKVTGFQSWIDEAMRQTVLAKDGAWTRPYIEQAVKLAKARAEALTGRESIVRESRVRDLASLTVVELQGVIKAVSQQAVRVLAHDMMANARPARIARDVAGRIDKIGKTRGRALVAYMVVKAFSSATLDAFRSLGIRKVGTIPERIKIRQTAHGKTLATDAARKTEQLRHHATGQFIAHPKGPGHAPTPKLSWAEIGRIVEREAKLAALERVDVLTAGDDFVCQVCEDISDEGPYDIDEAESLIPAHANAVLEGSSVASYGAMYEMVSAVFRGPAVRLRTSAKTITIGPNHPMLTRRGFVKASELYKGDQLLHDARADRASVGAGRPDLKQVPLVEDAFSAMFAAGDGARVAASHLDLHGDAVFCESEVKVVHPVRPLLPVFDALGIEELCKRDLVRSDISLQLEAALRGGRKTLAAALRSARSFVSGADLRKALAFAHAGPFYAFLLAGCSEYDSRLKQDAGNDPAAAFVSISDGEDSISASVGFQNGIYRWDRVLSVHVIEFSGLAFDASTETGLYNSDGHVVKNCRCAFVPAEDERFATDARAARLDVKPNL